MAYQSNLAAGWLAFGELDRCLAQWFGV